MNSKTKKLIAFALIGVVFYFYLNQSNMLGLLPGPEGPKVGVYSVQNPHTGFEYIVGSSSDPHASYSPTDPYNVRYDPDESDLNLPDLYVDLSKMWTEGEYKEDIGYWLQRSDGSWAHVTGFVQSFYFNVVFRAEHSADAIQPYPGYNVGYWGEKVEYYERWKSGTIWLATGPTIWNLAYPDPVENRKEGHVWASPLSAYVMASEIAEGSSKWIYMQPEAQAGRQVTLFSTAAGGNIIDIIGNQEPSNLNTTIKGTWGSDSPDTRMKSGIGYFHFIPNDFGEELWWSYTPLLTLNSRSPKVQYTIKMYYLVIGQWVYTQSQYEEWILGEAKQDIHKSLWESIGDWWTGAVYNPMTYVWLFISSIFMIMIVIVILAIFAPSLLGGLGRLIGRGKSESWET